MSREAGPEETYPLAPDTLKVEHERGEHSPVRRQGCPVCQMEAGRAARKRSRRRLPPGMTAIGASTPAGFLYVTLWRVFGEVTPFDMELARQAPDGSPTDPHDLDLSQVSPLVGNAVVTVAAAHAARGERPDLETNAWERIARVVWPTLSAQQRMDPAEISAAITLISPRSRRARARRTPPPRRGRGRPAWTPRQFWLNLREAEASAAPSRRPDDVAAEFRRLDGSKGVSTEHFMRLRARFGGGSS